MTPRELLETLEAYMRAASLAADATLPTKIRALATLLRDRLRAQLDEHVRQLGGEAP